MFLQIHIHNCQNHAKYTTKYYYAIIITNYTVNSTSLPDKIHNAQYNLLICGYKPTKETQNYAELVYVII